MTNTPLTAAERRNAEVQRKIDEAIQAYKDRITPILHDAAEEHSLCDTFDDVMEEIDLPRREFEYRVKTTVELEMTVIVKASSADRAEKMVRDDEDVITDHLWGSRGQPDEVDDYTVTVDWAEKEEM